MGETGGLAAASVLDTPADDPSTWPPLQCIFQTAI